MIRHERALLIVIAVYLLLAAAWAFCPTVFPHQPLRKAASFVPTTGVHWVKELVETQFTTSTTQWCVYLALLIAPLGLAQTRSRKLLGRESSRTMTGIFLVLVAGTAVGFWFLSFHRGTVGDRGPDDFVRSVSWFLFKAGLVIAIANVVYALARKQPA
jgi:uncharacterized membrane protein YidH (DUF202 family)